MVVVAGPFVRGESRIRGGDFKIKLERSKIKILNYFLFIKAIKDPGRGRGRGRQGPDGGQKNKRKQN